MITAVIIEDEPNSAKLLSKMIKLYCPELTLIGRANDVATGIEIIKTKEPDLVFLDIEMPGGDGFSVLNAFEQIAFKVIFVTSHDQYAIKAIKYAALDYLMKPVNLDDLQIAVNRATQQVHMQTDNIRFLQQQLIKKKANIPKMVISSQAGHKIINIVDIVALEAEGNYTFFTLADGHKHLASYPLSHYEEVLPANIFFRIHKSYIVNCHKVIDIDPGRTGEVKLVQNISFGIAARRKRAFLEFYKKFAG